LAAAAAAKEEEKKEADSNFAVPQINAACCTAKAAEMQYVQGQKFSPFQFKAQKLGAR
jgi:hypothetical protein